MNYSKALTSFEIKLRKIIDNLASEWINDLQLNADISDFNQEELSSVANQIDDNLTSLQIKYWNFTEFPNVSNLEWARSLYAYQQLNTISLVKLAYLQTGQTYPKTFFYYSWGLKMFPLPFCASEITDFEELEGSISGAVLLTPQEALSQLLEQNVNGYFTYDILQSEFWNLIAFRLPANCVTCIASEAFQTTAQNTFQGAVDTTIQDVVQNTGETLIQEAADTVVQNTGQDVIQSTADLAIQNVGEDIAQTVIDTGIQSAIDSGIQSATNVVVDTAVSTVSNTVVKETSGGFIDFLFSILLGRGGKL